MKTLEAVKSNYSFKYYHFVATLFVLFFIISKVIAAKFISIYGFIFNAGSLVFPLSYTFGDIVTEVYGYQRSRQLIWLTIGCNFIFVVITKLVILLPSASFWHNQTPYLQVFGSQDRLVMASAISYLLGEFLNCYVIAKMKIKFQNRFIWLRFISSTFLGVSVDISLFTFISFIGVIPLEKMLHLIICENILKISYEILMSPFSMYISWRLKQAEQVDIYDIDTNFNPLSVSVKYNPEANRF